MYIPNLGNNHYNCSILVCIDLQNGFIRVQSQNLSINNNIFTIITDHCLSIWPLLV